MLLIIPTLLGVSLVVMGMIRLLPGDAVDIMVSENTTGGGLAGFERLVDAELQKPSWPGVERVETLENVTFSQRQVAGLDVMATTAEVKGRAAAAGVDLNDTEARRSLVESIPTAERMAIRNAIALEAYKDSIREELGLDKSFLGQWWDWLTKAVRLDLGTSLYGAQSVNDELTRRLPVTIQLGAFAMLFGALVAIPTGIISAVRQDSLIDYVMRSFAVAMLSLPSFFFATLVIALLSRWFKYSFPIFYSDLWEDPLANLEQVLVPAFILGLALSGTLMRLTRTEMLEVLRQDYIRTARAKGLAARLVVLRHAVRNALLPIITILGIQIPVLIGGSVVIEVIFDIPGIAKYLYEAIRGRDYPPIIAVNMVVATIVVVTNLIVDVFYAYLDPRVKL
ncbi:MAG: ABC transporter permease [Dehalococcoidia bacterium]|nr:ABC transporter permease [Dehalococcoidia bacterium]